MRYKPYENCPARCCHSNYQKLKKEAGYAGLNSKQIEMAKIEEWGGTGVMKQFRKIAKEDNQRKHGG